jgi:hypothetical protein
MQVNQSISSIPESFVQYGSPDLPLETGGKKREVTPPYHHNEKTPFSQSPDQKPTKSLEKSQNKLVAQSVQAPQVLHQ